MNIKFWKNLMKNTVDNAHCDEDEETKFEQRKVDRFNSGVSYLGPIKKRKKKSPTLGFPK